MKIAVSSCLLGTNCKYNGGNNKNEELIEFLKEVEVVPICPECLGKLPVPRPPSEIYKDKVINNVGIDVTKNFINGATLSLALLIELGIEVAILKEKSPSCGSNYIYDGTFSSTVIGGKGITTKLLEENGIKVFNEFNYKENLKNIFRR